MGRWEQRMKRNFYPTLKEFIGKSFIYLEIGVFRGDTTEWISNNIATHPDCLLIGIDPWERSFFNRHDLRSDQDWMDLLNKISKLEEEAKGKIQFIKGYSEKVLLGESWKKESIDIIYIDGNHTREYVTRDFNLSWPLLKPNGILIFDDYLLVNVPEMTPAIDDILGRLPSDTYTLLFKNRQLGIRKLK